MKLEGNLIYVMNRAVGKVVENTFVTTRTPNKHFYIKGKGYPISEEVLCFLKNHNISDIIIIEHGRNEKRFHSKVVDYLNGDLIQHKPFEAQRVIPLSTLEILT